MKKIIYSLMVSGVLLAMSCNSPAIPSAQSESSTPEAMGGGQSGVKDDVSNPNVVQIAVGSKDHTTLVTAVKAANLVNVLSIQDHLQYLHQPMLHLINSLPAL